MIKGLSWTTEKAVAAAFARGHRGLFHKQPVIAATAVPKNKILFACAARSESEIIVKPSRFTVEYFQPGAIKKLLEKFSKAA